MNLFQKQTFKLHSGGVSDFKIECDAFTNADIETLAYIISKRIKFKDVVGVPRGGVRLEQALEKYKSDSGCFLIVDDVLTTGTSMEVMKQEVYGKSLGVKGVVVFARNKCPEWVEAIFQMWE
jgi:orotate phosphoribosyltransferase